MRWVFDFRKTEGTSNSSGPKQCINSLSRRSDIRTGENLLELQPAQFRREYVEQSSDLAIPHDRLISLKDKQVRDAEHSIGSAVERDLGFKGWLIQRCRP